MPRGRRPTPDEVRLWRTAMGDADPAEADAAEAPVPPAGRTTVPAHAQRAQPKGPAPARLDRHTTRALKRRRLVPEGRLDLHGMTQSVAHAESVRFLKEAYARGFRCVAVITGKGVRLPDDGADPFTRRETGVLRRLLPQWLDDPELSPLVIGSEPAPRRDGGDGARYVLLRRKGRG